MKKNTINSNIQTKDKSSEEAPEIYSFTSPAYNKIKTAAICATFLSLLAFLVYLFMKAFYSRASAWIIIGTIFITITGGVLVFSFFMVELTREVKIAIDDDFLYFKTPTGMLNSQIKLLDIDYLSIKVTPKKSLSNVQIDVYTKSAITNERCTIKLHQYQIEEMVVLLKKHSVEVTMKNK
ncbi:hypothetical protein BKI52_43850 [marine bacterium AO1-C]|nr:hypothetical protein BKI52_43850 [marine bacterium AO1-C]